MRPIWKWLALFCYRRWARGTPGDAARPVGIPGNRDPDNPCESYAPRPRRPADWADCLTDGHDLCWVCAHRKPTVQVVGGDIVDTAEAPRREPDGDVIRINLFR